MEGDIVDVPYGMRIIRKKAPNKSWLTNWSEKRKKYKEEGEILRSADEDPDLEGEDLENDLDEDHGDHDHDDGDGDVADRDEDDVEEGIEETIGDGEEDRPLNKPKYELQTDWIYKEVPIFTTSSAEKLASDMGLPITHKKLVKVQIRRQIEDVQIVHAGVQRMRVDKSGRLVPIEGRKRTVAVFDEEDYNRPRIAPIPDSFKPRAVKINKNPYNPDYSFGDYVRFVKDGAELEGVVMVYTEMSVGISVKTGIRESDMIFVDYRDPTLKKAIKPKKDTRALKSNITSDDVYAMTTIPDDIRKTVIDMYTKILDYIRTEPDIKAVVPVSPSGTKDAMKKTLLSDPPKEVLNWDQYYSNEFYKWIKHKYHDYFKSQVNLQKVADLVSVSIKQESNPITLLDEITSELPNGELEYTTTISDILNAARKIQNVTIFQAICIQALEKESYSGRGDVAGEELATILSNIIEKYYRVYPLDTGAYYKRIFDLELEHISLSYEPTENDTAEFNGLYLSALKALHDDAIKKYEEEKQQYERNMSELKKAASVIKQQSPFKNENRSQVERFEQLIFAMHGSSVHSYLSGVLLPHIFLEGPLAKHAKFFRSKIANGSFQFAALVGANIAHYLPEFAMNKDLTDEQWVEAGEAIGAILHNDVAGMVDSYIDILNPTSRVHRSELPYSNIIYLVNNIERMLVDPITECRDDTMTGFRPVISSGKYVLDPITKKLLEERIPEGDLAICYDPSSKKFTCHSTRDVMLAIAKGDLTNPHTRRPYPKDFVERIRTRNQTIIASLKQPEKPDPLPVKESPKTPGIREREVSRKTPEPKPLKAPRTRKRHVAPSKGNFEPITKMLLVGAVETFSLFNDSFVFTVSDDGEKIEQEIGMTYDQSDINADVAVMTFYADQPESIQDLRVQYRGIPARIKRVYVIGLDAKGVVQKDRVIYASRIRKIFSRVKNVFYSDDHDEDDIRDGLIDVVVDAEGVTAAE